jgi:rhodanese-related sulfurtransferase
MIVLAIGLLAQSGHTANRPPNNPKTTARTFDPALATPAAAAMFKFKDKKIILIDVRPQAEYAQYHIAGSLNIPLHAIKSKSFLKSKPIVLVNKGFVVSPLAQACQSLNQSGFKATILDGGLVAWKHKHGKLTGDPFAQNRMNRITPRTLDQEKAYAGLLIIDACASSDRRDKPSVPGARHLSLLGKQQDAKALKKLIKAEGAGPFTRLLIFTSTGRENERVQRRLDHAGIVDVFFLDGGLQAYEKHLQYLTLARRPAAERKVTKGGCKTCAQSN